MPAKNLSSEISVRNERSEFHRDKKSEKNIGRGGLTGKSVKKWVYPMKFCEADPLRDFIGVETKISGLKIGVILDSLTY